MEDEVARIISSKDDHHRVLGVPRAHTKEELRKKYKELAMKVHPDVNKSEFASEAFAILNNAYHDLAQGKTGQRPQEHARRQHRADPYAEPEEEVIQEILAQIYFMQRSGIASRFFANPSNGFCYHYNYAGPGARSGQRYSGPYSARRYGTNASLDTGHPAEALSGWPSVVILFAFFLVVMITR